MPRKSKSKDVQSTIEYGRFHVANDAQWGGFINIRVDDADKAAFELWYVDHRAEVIAALDDLMGEGMKVSLSYDHENECYICSFTGRGWLAGTSRWCMTTRAGTFDESIALALYKHFVMAEADWGDYLPSTGKKKNWG